MPQAFPAVPIMECSSERDSFCPRGTVRTRVFNTFEVAPSSVLALCPSPLSYGQESSQAIGAAYAVLTDNGVAFAVQELSTPFAIIPTAGYTAGDPWAQSPAMAPVWNQSIGGVATNDVWQDVGVNFNISPESMTPDKCGGVSLVGGNFLVNTVCPFEATAQVFVFGPSDASNVQGLCTGDCWKENPLCASTTPVASLNAPIEPRRQFARSAYYHASIDGTQPPGPLAALMTVLSNVKPDIISGASDVARRVYGFALVPDNEFTPLNDFGGQLSNPSDVLGPDYYNNNPLSGLFQGQGIIYIYNSGTVPITATAELYADFEITLNKEAQKYLSPDTYAMGMEGLKHTPADAYSFPGVICKSEPEAILRCAMARLPRAKRSRRFAKVLMKLIKSWMRNRTNLVNGVAKIVPKCQAASQAADSSGISEALGEVAGPISELNAERSEEHSKSLGTQVEDFAELMGTGGMSEISKLA
nr:hypothetical protein [Tolivirales sp.]